MLAPVLARLTAIPGVACARVDSSGRYFWIAPDPAADAARVAALAEPVLGGGVRRLPPPEAEAQLAARPRGDPWLATGEVMTLSFLESRLLSVRIAGEVERTAGATPEEREAVADAIRVELFAAMERVHAEGGRRSSGWIYAEWPAIAASAVRRCGPSISPALRERLPALLPDLLTR